MIPDPEALKPVIDWTDAHQEEAVADLQWLVQQPSVSAQNIGLREFSDLVVELMHKDGLDACNYELAGGPPVVIGHMASQRSE